MSKRKREKQVSQFVNLAESLRRERYRLAIVYIPPVSSKSKIAKAAENRLQARYIDLMVDLLSKMAMPGFSPTLGAYDANDLNNWILAESYKQDTNFIIIDNIEPLLATFGRVVKSVEFFQIASLIEPITPVILVTYLIRQVKDSDFPAERLLTL